MSYLEASEKNVTLELCKQLIKRASVTPDDAGCQHLIAERLTPLGFVNQHLKFGEVTNLWGLHQGDSIQTSSPSEKTRFVFAGHTDVVPTGDISAWHTDPFEPTIIGDKLYGRGVADMKASLAAMVCATERFIKNYPHYHGEIGFLITSDEEGPAINGTVKVMEYLSQHNELMDYCLVGEPSSAKVLGDTIRVGRRGSLGAALKVKGIQGHVAYPEVARNPIHKAAPALSALASEIWDEGNQYFPKTTFQITNMNSGTGATNVIPGFCDIQFNLRFSTEQSSEQLKSRVTKILDQHLQDYQITWRLSGEPFLTKHGKLIQSTCNAIQQEMGFETLKSTGGGTSDGRFIAPYGVEVVELGPCNKSIHQVNEHLHIEEIIRLTDIYYRVLESIFLQEA